MQRNLGPSSIKQLNIGTLLKHIRTKGPISRAELVKTTKLSPTTVSVLVEHLLDEGLVKEVGTGESSGGRRPILLKFEPSARSAVGVDIGVHRTTIAQLDLNGSTLESINYTPDLSTKEAFLEGIVVHLKQLLAKTRETNEILGIGVTTPGLLDKARQNILYSSSLGFSDVPLYSTLAEHFSLPIRIDNDMNGAALGEKIMGAGKQISNLIYISVETGIGAGIILDNRIYRGATGNAGEFGHTTVEPSGLPCKCGNKGCLGVMAGEPALLGRAIHLLSIGTETKITDYCQGSPYQVTKEAIMEAARAGDAIALGIIQTSMDYLALGIANLINMFDPAAIILGGSLIEAFHPIGIEQVRSSVQERVLPYHKERSAIIIPSKLKGRVKLVGAGTLIFSEFLDYAEVMTIQA